MAFTFYVMPSTTYVLGKLETISDCNTAKVPRIILKIYY